MLGGGAWERVLVNYQPPWACHVISPTLSLGGLRDEPKGRFRIKVRKPVEFQLVLWASSSVSYFADPPEVTFCSSESTILFEDDLPEPLPVC